MKKFIILSLKFLSPFIILILVYVVMDPFKIIRHYDSYYESEGLAQVGVNKDFMSTSNFINNYGKYKYDSFIFGNSRSMFYDVADWMKYLPQNSSPYHFDASGESLYGIHKKVMYLDDEDINIANVLLVLDHATLSQDKGKPGHLFMISPQLVSYSNYLEFHTAGLRAFYTKDFFKAYIDYKVTGEVKPYMTRGALLQERPLKYDPKTNEVRFFPEEDIDSGKYFTPERMAVFYKRDNVEKTYPAAIGINQEKMLNDMAKVFKKHKTDVKVIINPLYDQKKINPADLNYLERKFGKNNVHDFSGINEITNDYRNYYEDSHYRPRVGRIVLSSVYGAKQ